MFGFSKRERRAKRSERMGSLGDMRTYTGAQVSAAIAKKATSASSKKAGKKR